MEIIPKIVGANESIPFKYPWLTSIQVHGKHICSGVLLDLTTMITAAHCSIVRVNPWLRVKAHRFDLRYPGWYEKALKFRVDSIKVHEQFRQLRTGYINDIAVWKLVRFQGSKYRLPEGSISLDDGTYTAKNRYRFKNLKLKIAGWGSTTDTDELVNSDRIHESNVTVTTANCIPNLICGSVTVNKSICRGDHGGPLFAEKRDGKVALVGIASFGWGDEGCSPGSYLLINQYVDWINQNSKFSAE